MDGTFCERPERPTPTCQESKAGDTAAFQEIVIVKQPLVLRVAQRLLLNAEDAKDAAQEVFIRLHHTLHRFDAEQEIGPWLYTSGQGSSDTVTKIIHVRYADPGRLADLVGLGLPIRIDADRTLKVIVVKGPPTLVTSVEQTIHELDVPSTAVARPRDVELIVSVIGGSSATETATAAQPSDDLGPVIKQLRAIFPYKNYQLLSSMLLRSREGTHATNNGLMKNLGNTNYSRPSSYVVGFDAAEVSQEGGKPNIHVHNFRFTTRIPFLIGLPSGAGDKGVSYSTTQFQEHEITIASDVDLHDGQKVVVGKADIANSDSALFVVLTARLVE